MIVYIFIQIIAEICCSQLYPDYCIHAWYEYIHRHELVMCSNYCTARKCEWLISVSLIVGFPFETLTQLTAALCNVASLGHFRGNCAAPLFLGTCGVTVTQLIFSWQTRCTSGLRYQNIPNVSKFCPFFFSIFLDCSKQNWHCPSAQLQNVALGTTGAPLACAKLAAGQVQGWSSGFFCLTNSLGITFLWVVVSNIFYFHPFLGK